MAIVVRMLGSDEAGVLANVAEGIFDGTVRGNWGDLRRLAGDNGEPAPEVTIERFNKRWP